MVIPEDQPDAILSNPTFSPDSSLLSFEVKEEPTYAYESIWIFNTDTGNLTNHFNPFPYAHNLKISPNNRFISTINYGNYHMRYVLFEIYDLLNKNKYSDIILHNDFIYYGKCSFFISYDNKYIITLKLEGFHYNENKIYWWSFNERSIVKEVPVQGFFNNIKPLNNSYNFIARHQFTDTVTGYTIVNAFTGNKIDEKTTIHGWNYNKLSSDEKKLLAEKYNEDTEVTSYAIFSFPELELIKEFSEGETHPKYLSEKLDLLFNQDDGVPKLFDIKNNKAVYQFDLEVDNVVEEIVFSQNDEKVCLRVSNQYYIYDISHLNSNSRPAIQLK